MFIYVFMYGNTKKIIQPYLPCLVKFIDQSSDVAIVKCSSLSSFFDSPFSKQRWQ